MKYEILGKATFRVNFDIDAEDEIEAEEKAKQFIKDNTLPSLCLTDIKDCDIYAVEIESDDVIV
jgi:hypothetical protein